MGVDLTKRRALLHFLEVFTPLRKLIFSFHGGQLSNAEGIFTFYGGLHTKIYCLHSNKESFHSNEKGFHSNKESLHSNGKGFHSNKECIFSNEKSFHTKCDRSLTVKIGLNTKIYPLHSIAHTLLKIKTLCALASLRDKKNKTLRLSVFA